MAKTKKEKSEKEKTIQEALGTYKRQMFVSADWKDPDALVIGFHEACKNFGLHMYYDPEYQGSDTYGIVISDCKLTTKQLNKLCENE